MVLGVPNAPEPADVVPRPQAPVRRRRLGNGRNGQTAGRGARVQAGAADRNGFRDLRVVEVHKSFGESKVLHGIDLSIESGRTLSLLGPSGCGKTTLMRIVSGLDVADRGEVHVGERLLAGPGVNVAPESRRIGLLGQERSLFPHLSVGGNVAYGLGRAADRGARVREVLEMVDLAGFEKRMPDSLSGGQQQRVAIARALAPRPRMLLLDEPFQALDVQLRIELQTEVRALLGALGATAVIVTHDQDEAFVMGDEVAVMQDGHIRQCGTPRRGLQPSRITVGCVLRRRRQLRARSRLGLHRRHPAGHPGHVLRGVGEGGGPGAPLAAAPRGTGRRRGRRRHRPGPGDALLRARRRVPRQGRGHRASGAQRPDAERASG